MMIRVRLGIAAALGLLVAFGSGFSARAQVGGVGPNGFSPDGIVRFLTTGGTLPVRFPTQGTWAEVINVTSRWIVVQNPDGQQFPIASDRIRQFLIRWPSSIDQLTPNSMVEVTGPQDGSNVVIADHMDVYEGDAQGLVSPTVDTLMGNNKNLSAFDFTATTGYAFVYLMSPAEYMAPWKTHLVGHSVGLNPVQVSGFGNNTYIVQPGAGGMSVSRVTLGNNTYARRGDLVYLTVANVGQRGLDVSQLVLYKRVPINLFQP